MREKNAIRNEEETNEWGGGSPGKKGQIQISVCWVNLYPGLRPPMDGPRSEKTADTRPTKGEEGRKDSQESDMREEEKLSGGRKFIIPYLREPGAVGVGAKPKNKLLKDLAKHGQNQKPDERV